MFDKNQTIENFDAEVWHAMQQEDQRQEQHIELIASENYTSPAVMAAQGGQMTNKYAEGYPGKRYYGGCEYVDITEQLAIDRWWDNGIDWSTFLEKVLGPRSSVNM